PVTRATCLSDGRSASAPSRLRTSAPLTVQFSASVGWRIQVARKTWLGATPSSAWRRLSGCCRSAATGLGAGMSGGGGGARGRAARQAMDRPALLQKKAGEVVADDAAGADDEGGPFHRAAFLFSIMRR